MARSRNLKPGFFKNEELAKCNFAARLLFAGLWCLADREGRLEDRPGRIRAELFPYEMKVDADKLLHELAEHELILRYEADGRQCIWVTGFHRNQTPHHMEEPSQLPPPPGIENRFNHSPVTKQQRQRIFARDGHQCVECKSTRRLTIDHTIPVSKRGSSDDSNLRTLCKKCNETKGNRERIENESTSTCHQRDKTDSPYIVRGNQLEGISNKDSGTRAKQFTPPTVEAVAAYCAERQNAIDAQKFVDFYISKGWKVGNQPMKDWQAAVRTWEKNEHGKSSHRRSHTGPGQRSQHERDPGIGKL